MSTPTVLPASHSLSSSSASSLGRTSLGDTLDSDHAIEFDRSSSSSSMIPLETSSSSSSSSSAPPTSPPAQPTHRHTPRHDLDAIPIAGEGGLFPANSPIARCLTSFNIGLQDLRLLFMLLPMVAIVLFVTHHTAAGIAVVLVSVLLTCAISYRLLLLLRARHIQYAQLGQGQEGGLGMGRHRSLGALQQQLRYAQLMGLGQSQSSTAMRLAMRDGDFTANDYEELLRLDEEHRAQTHNGLTPAQIDRLPTFKIPAADPSQPVKDDQCSICLEKKLPGETVRALICFHSFHVKCITPWLLDHTKCPICQFSQASA